MTLPIVTSGLTSGLRIAGQLFVDPEKELILPDLYWGNYKLIFDKESFTTYSLFSENGFNVQGFTSALQSAESACTLFCFPNNPSGYSPTATEVTEILAQIKAVAQSGKKVVVLVDDAYVGLGYTSDVEQVSIFSSLATLHENVVAVKIDGITKEYFAWGLRVGFLTFGYKGMTQEAAHVLEQKAASIIRGSYSSVSTPAQLAALRMLQDPNTEAQRKEAVALLAKRFAAVQQILENENYADHFVPVPHNSGYFMCVRPLQHEAETIRKRLLAEDFSVGVIATNGLLRIAFSCVPTNQLERVFASIYSACIALSN